MNTPSGSGVSETTNENLPKIRNAFIRIEKRNDLYKVVGVALSKDEGTWFLFETNDQDPIQHPRLSTKIRNLRVSSYRNLDIAEPDINDYLNDEKTRFAFKGKLLKQDLENSITDAGILYNHYN